jgi:hypothetical protein
MTSGETEALAWNRRPSTSGASAALCGPIAGCWRAVPRARYGMEIGIGSRSIWPCWNPLTAVGPALGLGLWLLLVLVVVTAVTLAVASLARDAPGVVSDAATARGSG